MVSFNISHKFSNLTLTGQIGKGQKENTQDADLHSDSVPTCDNSVLKGLFGRTLRSLTRTARSTHLLLQHACIELFFFSMIIDDCFDL